MISKEDYCGNYWNARDSIMYFHFKSGRGMIAVGMKYQGDIEEGMIEFMLEQIVRDYANRHCGPAPGYMLNAGSGADRNFRGAGEQGFDVVRCPHWRQDRDDINGW